MSTLLVTELVLGVLLVALLLAFAWRARSPHTTPPTIRPSERVTERSEAGPDALHRLDRLTERLEQAVRDREERGRAA